MATNVMIPIQQRLGIQTAPIDQSLHQFECDFRCHIPAIVVANPDGNAFDPVKLTVSVQPAIKEVMRKNAVLTPTTLPILDDVPIKIPGAGGMVLTFPIAIGDECELSFQDMGIDLWWQSGGVQQQMDGKLYRHDIGDAIADFGPRSLSRPIPNYSTTNAQLRTVDGTVILDMAEAGITATAPAMTVKNGGTAQALMTDTFFQWFTLNVYPFLVSKGYAGPPIPVTGCETTILEAQ